MDQDDFVRLALVAFGLVILSFFVMGFTRIVLSTEVARLLGAPFGIIGFALVVYLFVRATLSAVGIWAIERP